jgi:hypothetical protein
MFVSAEIIQFIPRPRHDREFTDFPTIVFRSAAHDHAMDDDADTAPCEHVAPDSRDT